MAMDPAETRHRLEAAQAAELARLRDENETLRSQVDKLRKAMGLTLPAPPAFAASDSRQLAWSFLCALAKRGTLTHEAAMIALYGDRDPGDWPKPKILKTLAHHARKFLEAHGVTFQTEWGAGWSMTEPMQIRTQRIIAQLAKGKAA
jgi:hypothetical protein